MITGTDHVHLIAGDPEKSAKYFKDMFDATEISRGEMRGFQVIRVDVKGLMIVIMGTDPNSSQFVAGKGTRGLDHFGFRVKDMEATAADLKKKGAKFLVEPTDGPGGIKFAFIEGPEAIRIELCDRG